MAIFYRQTILTVAMLVGICFIPMVSSKCYPNDGVLCTPTNPCKEHTQKLSHFTMGEVNPSGACIKANAETPGKFIYCFDPGFSGEVKVSVKIEVNLDPSKKLVLSLYYSTDPTNPKRKRITNGDQAFSTVLSSNFKPNNKVTMYFSDKRNEGNPKKELFCNFALLAMEDCHAQSTVDGIVVSPDSPSFRKPFQFAFNIIKSEKSRIKYRRTCFSFPISPLFKEDLTVQLRIILTVSVPIKMTFSYKLKSNIEKSQVFNKAGDYVFTAQLPKSRRRGEQVCIDARTVRKIIGPLQNAFRFDGLRITPDK